MGYQYTYLLMGLIFLAIWLALFIWRKNTRKEMLIISIIFGIIGPFVEFIYTTDWWNPQFLFGFSSAGIEDVLFGFVCGGIAAVVYEDIFKKKLKIRKVSKTKEEKRNISFLFILTLAAFLFFIPFFVFGLNSLYSTIIGLSIPTLIIWIKRKDLILDSLATGIILVLITSLVYSILEFLTPGWVSAFWHFKNVPNLIILNVPIDDIIWYFLAGLFIGPLYEYWQESKLVDA